ncbi:MAG: hypothetical protein KIS91_07400 [Anaerolineae bacterium]|nr:hypothetical protein [Anaerolineae bacterium]
MEVVVLGAIALVVLALNAIGAVFVFGRGSWRWEAADSRDAKGLWAAIVAVGVSIAGIVFGLSALITLWPFWLALLALSAAFFGVQDWLIARRSQPLATTTTAPALPAPMTWDALWRSYEGRELPPWMLQQAHSGQVRYDGKLARVHQGMLVPQPTAPRAPLDGAFDRLDRLLGG